MFEPRQSPRVFALPCGVDFATEVIAGLRARLADQPPDAMARVELIVNTNRTARRLRDLFDAGPAGLLPRISLLGEATNRPDLPPLPPATPSLRRRLELVQLIGELLERQPDLAARASMYDLADSLAALMSEMSGEGVPPEAVRTLDVTDQSGHWQRALSFISIADQFISSDGSDLDSEARQRLATLRLIEAWRENPPSHPVILAGSTGSRGTTALLMQAVASLPQGALILPGFDFDMDQALWETLDHALVGEDHPQYRFAALMRMMQISASDIQRWTDTPAPDESRNKALSLALRPAPVTDAWLTEGPALPELPGAMQDVTLIEAENPRHEALTIALRLRKAAETGQSAALITPDRMLSRQVAAALDRWDIVPDDSAGQPLQLSPPGRFLRHVLDLFTAPLTGETLLTLLKHPLCHSGSERGDHLRLTRDLELHLRRKGPPFPDANALHAIGQAHAMPPEWINWLCACFADQQIKGGQPLALWIKTLRELAERIAAGPTAEGAGQLWAQNAGMAALNVVDQITAEAEAGGDLVARDFADLFGAVLAGEEVRDRDAPTGHVMIWGTLEARVMGADLLILGGLNEGSWPEPPKPDPWLNRTLRHRAGLLLPERRIGLSAHDFQQAAGAKEVWLSRAVRSDDAETIASRWVNRLTNLLSGLPQRRGPDALQQMRDRGAEWLEWANTLDDAPEVPRAGRPSPRPPVAARPRQLSVTEIKKLIRDPYAIYARHVLRLKPLDPLAQAPDALLRGIVVHAVLEAFIKERPVTGAPDERDRFLALAQEFLNQEVPWPVARHLWQARLERIVDWFLETEKTRQELAQPSLFEVPGKRQIPDLGFTLKGVADRIDIAPGGALRIYDYKTGAPPSEKQQQQFDKQLLLEAALAADGGFGEIGPSEVEAAEFIGLGSSPKTVPAPLEETPPEQVWRELADLIGAYLSPDQGFTARRAMFLDTDISDYDHLSRYGEWDRASESSPEVLK